jgi:hypothetical protein
MACTQGLEGLCVAGLGEILGNPWPPLAIILWHYVQREAPSVIAKSLVTTFKEVTKPAIRRLAHRGGVKRISGLIYEETWALRADFETMTKN